MISYEFDQNYETVFKNIKDSFPLVNYMDEIVYHQTKFILKSILNLSTKHASKLKLLDIGCGPMEKTAIFSNFGMQCYAADDLSDPWHREGNNLNKIINFSSQNDIKFHLQKKSDYSIPFDKGSFDVVMAIEVIEHLHASPRSFIEIAKQYLRPGGLLVLTTPNSVNLRKRISVFFGKTNYPNIKDFYSSGDNWRGHVREYTLDELEWCVKQSDLDIVLKDSYEPFAHKKLSGLWKKIYITLGNLNKHFRSGLVVIGKR